MPKLGDLDVKVIETADVIAVLKPIWNDKPETASRLCQWIEAVLDYATAMGVRAGDNPARWRGHLDHLLPKPSQVRAVKHHAAMEYLDIPDLWLPEPNARACPLAPWPSPSLLPPDQVRCGKCVGVKSI